MVRGGATTRVQGTETMLDPIARLDPITPSQGRMTLPPGTKALSGRVSPTPSESGVAPVVERR